MVSLFFFFFYCIKEVMLLLSLENVLILTSYVKAEGITDIGRSLCKGMEVREILGTVSH